MHVDSNLGFDWGALANSVAQAGVAYSTQKNAAKIQLARIVAENNQAMELQRAALMAAAPPLPTQPAISQMAQAGQTGIYQQPTQGYTAPVSAFDGLRMSNLLIPGAIGLGVLLVMAAGRRR